MTPSAELDKDALEKAHQRLGSMVGRAENIASGAMTIAEYLQTQAIEIERLQERCAGYKGQVEYGAARIAELEKELAEARSIAHYADGTCDLAIKHRDIAETQRDAALKALRPSTHTEALVAISIFDATPESFHARFKHALDNFMEVRARSVLAAINDKGTQG